MKKVINKKDQIKAKVKKLLSGFTEKDVKKMMDKKFDAGYRLYKTPKNIAGFVMTE